MAKVTYQKYAHGARGWQLFWWFLFYYVLIDRMFFFGYVPFIERYTGPYVSIINNSIMSYDPSGGGNWLDVFSGVPARWAFGTALVALYLGTRMPYNFLGNLFQLF